MKKRALWLPLLAAVLVVVGFLGPQPAAGIPSPDPTSTVVARVHYADQEDLNAIAGQLDIWEVHREEGYIVAAVPPAQYQWLSDLGYEIEVDAEETQKLGIQAALDPRFFYFDNYNVNPNGRYIVDFLEAINTAYPDLTELMDVGDAWQTSHGGYQRDIWVLRVTNEDPSFGDIAEKPAFFLHAEVHAREVATPELAIRYIQYLTSGFEALGGYGMDADVTWMVDHNVAYFMVVSNPDGRIVNEQNIDAYRRKNMDNDDGCSSPSSWGVDLNRNHSFKWGCCGGSSGDPCSETYRGVARGSEPETQAFQTFFGTVMQDQNGDNGDDELPPAAPDDATGTFLSLHSYQDEILWPWGFQSSPAPNGDQLEAIGRKLAYYNGFLPTQTLYTVDGDTYDWTYGKFGIASFLFEVGPTSGACGDFFPAYGCIDGIDGMTRDFWAEQRPAFIFLHKIANTPYMTVFGPDTADVAVSPVGAAPGDPVQLTATIADQRYSNDPLQPIAAAEYFVDAPGADGTGIPLAPADGAWGSTSEEAMAAVDTSELDPGQHYILVHGQNSSGDWGPLTAAFLYVLEPGVSPIIQGYVRDASNNAPLAAIVKAGSFQTESDAETGFYSMMVIAGTYDMTAEADGYGLSVVPDVAAEDYQTVEQDFALFPICEVFADDVESGNVGWTADAPWAITDEASHSPSHSWTDSPGASYGNYLDIKLTSPVLDLSETDGVKLYFWHMMDLEAGADYGYVEYSTNGGATWTTAAAYSLEDQNSWTQAQVDLPGLSNQAGARIRFRLVTNWYAGSFDGWHIDDVVLAGGDSSCWEPMAPEPAFVTNSPVAFGEAVEFTNQTLGTPPLDYVWDFGDGLGTSTEVNPEYVYAQPGTYEVSLTATNSEGTASTANSVVVIGNRLYLPLVLKGE